MSKSHQAIRVVSSRTGLSTHVIRIWEKRYGAVTPERTGTKRRLYSDEQIERLSLLRDLTRAGHSIGHVATLPTEKLRLLVKEAYSVDNQAARPLGMPSGASLVLDECVAAIRILDARAFEEALKRGAVELGAQGMLQRIIAPLAQKIGDMWRNGHLTAAHEHFASAVIRVFLGQAAKPFTGSDQSPVLVVATPTGQLHELGALLVGAAASNLGWHVAYLGASLPAAEIAGIARQSRARAVALSLVYPEDDPSLPGELLTLRHSLPPDVALLVGGRAMPAYRHALNPIGAILTEDLTQFGIALDRLRQPSTR